MQSLEEVRYRLLCQIEGDQVSEAAPPPVPGLTPPSALEQFCELFGLSNFERFVLLLCVAVELSDRISSLCGSLQGNTPRGYATFSLALMLYANPHWSALTPDAPLRRWRLVEVGGGSALTTSPLRVDERILHYLLGIQHLDERLNGIVAPVQWTGGLSLSPSHRQLATELVALGLTNWQRNTPPAIQLCGSDRASKRAIAVTAATQAGQQLLAIAAEALPADVQQLNLVRDLCWRESRLTQSALLLDCDYTDVPSAEGSGGQRATESAIASLIDTLECPLLVSTSDRRAARQRPLITFNIKPPPHHEQRHLWETHLGDMTAQLNGNLDTLVGYFNLSSPAIHAACEQAKRLVASQAQPDLGTALWQACLGQSRPTLSDLAQPIDVAATWDDLVLPDKEKTVLHTIAAHVRQRAKVYETWGFATKSRRGLGISALFAGVSGTGKTMAAEVLANDLQLDLYRIDLSSVVSKYIGETEKNLRRVFDAAEAGGAILLFDEADSLFGKRSEVKDSHDRYANMEVSYLLQRIEAYRGLAILTTNLKSSLDQAFLRRIRFVVQFPFPDASQRAEIWQRIFPRQTPTQGLLPDKLARLNVAGGNIRNIALNAAFLAADADEPVQMLHILQAAQAEYVKLERPLTDAEIKGWLP